MTQEQREAIIRKYGPGRGSGDYDEFLGAELADLGEGFAVVRVVPTKGQLNKFGRVHGGTISGLIDSVGGLAAMTTLKRVVTAEMSVSFIGAASESEELVVSARVVHSGKTLTRVSVEVKSISGREIARGSLTFFALGQLEI